MPGNNVADFSKHLKKKQKKERLIEIVSASGWELDGDVLEDSEACVYLIDSQTNAIVLFGCKKKDFVSPGSDNVIHWGHFVAAWDVIADPDMPYDAKHKENTVDFAMRALAGAELWPPLLKKLLSDTEMTRPHVLVIIDRSDLDVPLDVILARSESLLLNTESIQSILDSYKENV